MNAPARVEIDAAAELAKNLADPMWRIANLYKIIVKGDEDDEGLVIQFKPNRAQRRFLARLHHRNIILKARQLGFTTLICIAWLDHALFNPNSRCGIIAQDRETAESIFTDKVKFAYDNLPEELKAAMPLTKCTTSELRFGHNNSMIRVATSVRGGTIHRLHISEFGKICAKFPDKAKEVVTGSIPAVPQSGIVVIESTAEGQEGEFYTMTQRAIALDQTKKPLTTRDYRFHFFPWWQAPEYRMNPDGVALTDKDNEYFAEVEAGMDCELDPEQRAWYIATRNADFSGEDERMWQEYPSTPEEAFKVSTEGCYYAKQFAAARKEGRIRSLPFAPGTPVNTFWDIGNSDGTAIWFHQKIGPEDRFIRFMEGWGETYGHFVTEMQKLGYVFGTHYLPHDADHVRQGTHANKSPKQMLEELWPGQRFEIVERIDDVNTGIQQARNVFGSCWFDDTHCAAGIVHLERYRKQWNKTLKTWSREPRHDIHSEAADAFRQFAQAVANGGLYSGGNYKRKTSSWRTA